jgi:hypothetical protein
MRADFFFFFGIIATESMSLMSVHFSLYRRFGEKCLTFGWFYGVMLPTRGSRFAFGVSPRHPPGVILPTICYFSLWRKALLRENPLQSVAH